MLQSSITAFNLLLEKIESKNFESYEIIARIESELDNDHLVIEETCFDFIKNYKIPYDQSVKVFEYMRTAESLERIGDLCLNIAKTAKYIGQITDIKSDQIAEIISYSTNLKKILTTCNFMVKINNFTNEIKSITDENILLRKTIKERLIESMKNSNKIEIEMKLIAILNYLSRLEKIIIKIS